jgi:hypothetical protein
MLKRYSYVFISPAIYCYAYADNTYGKTMVYFTSTSSIQNSKFVKNGCVNSV